MKESTSVREAIRQWEEEFGQKAHEAKEVKLIGLYPPIDKTDPSLQTLINCEKLIIGDTLEQLWISYNQIEKLKGINSLKNLKEIH
ncbi:Dynein light chain 1, axonemal [Armadillidium nasatum]|uniref:Dynein light chain 1, axonemal n=1 Tax=Armadillidium nasatum TaxID=96803 RepID=A0A5N5TLL0_9CRUS|nr:Dynein light chain 1, axonemal [Armadillidium nasatum]